MFEAFRAMRIGRQLAISTGLAIVVFTAVLTAVTSMLIARQLRAGAIADARLQAEQFAEGSLFAFLVDDPSVAEEAISAMTAFPAIDEALLARATGEIIAKSEEAVVFKSDASGARHVTRLADEGDHWLVAAPVLSKASSSPLAGEADPSEFLGTAVIAYSKAPYRKAIRTIWVINAVAGLVAAALFILLLTFQMRVLTGPLSALSQTMSSGRSDRNWRRAQIAGSEEVREIARVYNDLMKAVARSQAALESEVAIRTEELKAARDAALGANRQKSEIMAAVTHEMKTPLQAIVGYAQLTLEEIEFALEEEVAARSRDQLQNILSRASELLTRITQMLDLARAEAGKFDLTLSETNVGALLKDTVKAVAPLAAERNNRLHIDIDCQALIVIDRDKIHQIAVNLLTNACKFTDGGDVTIRCRMDEKALVIEVEDTGIGIAESDLGLIFEPFRQLDMSSKRARGGTGLGLAVTREFVKLLGGKISVISRVGRGSTFTVSIPRPVSAGV